MSLLNKWYALSEQEHRTIIVGATVAITLLGYLFIWSPLTTARDHMREQFTSQKDLYQWMQQVEPRIQALKKEGFPGSPGQDEPLLALTQQILNDKRLSRYLTQMQQPQAKQLVLTFHKVPFDSFIRWLQVLTHQYAVEVPQLKANPTDPSGSADIHLTLQKS